MPDAIYRHSSDGTVMLSFSLILLRYAVSRITVVHCYTAYYLSFDEAYRAFSGEEG